MGFNCCWGLTETSDDCSIVDSKIEIILPKKKSSTKMLRLVLKFLCSLNIGSPGATNVFLHEKFRYGSTTTI